MFARLSEMSPGLKLGVLLGLALIGSGLVWLLIRRGAGQRRNPQRDAMLRAAKFSSLAAVDLAMIAGIIAVVNVCASVYSKHWDLTRQGFYSLSDQTVRVLGLFKGKKVKFLYFGRNQNWEKDSPFLKLYPEAEPSVELTFHNTSLESALAEKLKVVSMETLVIANEDLSRIRQIYKPNEESITNALLTFTRARSPRLCLTHEHGERKFSMELGDYDSYFEVNVALSAQSYFVVRKSLKSDEHLLEDCDALGIFGPADAFSAEEVKALRAYLESGGHVFLSLDLNSKMAQSNPELVGLLADWGIGLSGHAVVDTYYRAQGGDGTVVLVKELAEDQPIASNLSDRVFMPWVQTIEFHPSWKQPATGAAWTFEWLARSSEYSWAVGDAGEFQSGHGQPEFDPLRDARGPHVLAVAGSESGGPGDHKRAGRLVVIGGSTFASSRNYRMGSNSDFLLNAISWLVEDEHLVGSRKSKEMKLAIKSDFSREQVSSLFFVSVVLLPLLMLSGAAWAMLRKRRL